MPTFLSAHLFFCEGPHDAAFISLLLKRKFNFSRINLTISELPYPFKNIIQQSMSRRSAEDLRLDLAKKFFLPDFTLSNGEKIIMIFNYGGINRRAESISQFLVNAFDLIKEFDAFGSTSDESEQIPIQYSIFSDADSKGSEVIISEIQNEFETIGDHKWISDSWTGIEGSRGLKQDTEYGTTSTYVWRNWESDDGTLESVIMECLHESEGLRETLQFIDRKFNWTKPNANAAERCTADAKRLKAGLCIEGQHKRPGGSLSVALDQADLISLADLEKSPTVRDCEKFLRDLLS